MHGNIQSENVQKAINAANVKLDDLLQGNAPTRVDIGQYIVERTGNFYQVKWSGAVIRTAQKLSEIRETIEHRIREDAAGRSLPLAANSFAQETRATHPEPLNSHTTEQEFVADNKL